MNAYLLGQQLPEVWDFGMFSIAKVGYQAQVIPALLAGLALGVIETRLKRIVPDYLYLVVVPVCSLILAVFLAHALIGPFGRMIGDGVAFAVRHLMTGSFAPIGAALFGFLYAPLVITGVHQTTLAIDLQMIQSMGGTPVWPLIALSNIAQGSAVIGIIISSRKHNEREISVPAAISAWLGVTEPAMYGINLKYRFPMLCAMIGSGLAGLLCGLVRRYGEWYRRRRPAGNSLDSTELLAGICAGNGYRHHHPDCTHLVYLSAEIPPGHAGYCLIFFGAQLRPSHLQE